jgi:argininosuccinate lyase
MQTLWKQERGVHPTFAPINASLHDDWFLLPHELKLQRVHAEVLKAAGILKADELTALLGALDRIEREHLGKPVPESSAEDLHTWIEVRLTDIAGEAGRKIHTARSRNDQVATLLKMYVMDAGTRLSQGLAGLSRLFCQRAQDWSELVMPLQTHTQFAAPGTAGYWALRYAVSFDRIRRHVEFCGGQWRSSCPLGSGAVAGSSIAIGRMQQARGLGFDAPSANALESTSTRDECVEWLSLASQVAMHLQSFSCDVINFAQTPMAWVKYPADFGTGSSMMPNKRNPDAMELLRGECCAIQAAQFQATMLLKGLPSGYNRDLQCIKPIIRDAAAKMDALLTMTRAFAEKLDFDGERMAASMAVGSIDATLRMEKLVGDGVPLREAHRRTAESLTSAAGQPVDWKKAVNEYQTIGSASPAETRRVAAELLTGLGDGM